MLKLKICLMLVLTVVIYTLSTTTLISNFYRERLREDVVHDIKASTQTILRAKRLDDHGQIATAEELCRWPKFVDRFEQPYDEGIEGKDLLHQLLWEELSVWDKKLRARKDTLSKHQGQKLEDEVVRVPDMMYVTDANGEGLASLTDYGWWGVDVAQRHPIVKSVGGTGRLTRDLWMVDRQMLEVTVCPLSNADNKFVGSVILGYILSNGVAEHYARLTGHDLVLFHNERVTAGTLGTQLHQGIQKDIVQAEKVHETGRLSPDKDFELDKTRYVATASFFGGYASNAVAGFVVLANLDEAVRPVSRTTPWTLLGAFMLMLFLVGGSLLIIQGLIKPLEEIDAGVHEIINGNFDYTFPTSATKESLAGSIAHALNLMVCILLGKPIPEDDDAVGGSWDGDPLFIDEVSKARIARPQMSGIPGMVVPKKTELSSDEASDSGTGTEPTSSDGWDAPAPAEEEALEGEEEEPRLSTQEFGALKDEPAEAYYRRIFTDYIEAREINGEPTGNITFEKFRDKLIKNEAALRQKLSCKQVRFKVQTKGGKVSLKPVPLD